MTLIQLQYIKRIAEVGSINIAAKQLHISQPSLSKATKELENEIGKRLFNRTNRGITITEEGREFIEYASCVISSFQILQKKYLS